MKLLTRSILSILPLLTAMLAGSVSAIESPVFIAQRELLPPPPAGPHPVPDPDQFNLDPNASSFRVMAIVTSAIQEKQFKVAYPDAFATNHFGRRVMQIGRFSDPMNAQQAAMTLQNLGMEILIEP